MKAWKFVLGPLIILTLSMTACGTGGSSTADQVQQTAVVRGDLTTNVSGSGKIALVQDAKLSFGSAGKLEIMNIQEGDKVSKGQVLAKLETDALEVSLASALVSKDSAEVGLTQAQIALDAAYVTQIQAQSALTAAQFSLDKIQAVADITDAITKIQTQIDTTEANISQALIAGDSDNVAAGREYIKDLQVDLAQQTKKLNILLGKSEYANYTAELTFSPYQTYDRLVVESVRMKELAVEAAQKVVDESGSGITVAQQNISKAQDAITLAQKNIDYIQKQIDDSTITAPFEGVVAARYYKQGDIVPSPLYTAQTVIYLVDTADLEVDANIDELDASTVQAGQTAEISVDALPGASLEGKVSVISVIPNAQAAAAGTTAYVAKVLFSVPEGMAVKTGMNANVKIVTGDRKGVLLLPSEAIKKDSQGQTYVEVMSNQAVSKQPVTIGESAGTQTEIVRGLNEGDKVVTGLSLSLR